MNNTPILQVLAVGNQSDEVERLRKACLLEQAEFLHVLSAGEIPSREQFDPSVIALTTSLDLEERLAWVERADERSRHFLFLLPEQWTQLEDVRPLGCVSADASVEEIRLRLREAVERLESRHVARLGSPILPRGGAWDLLPTADWGTGLDNRVRFLQEIRKNLSRARRYKRPFCCILACFSNRDALCDEVGEDTVDEIFEDLAGILEMSIRDADVVARVQSDTFGLLLTETSLQNAHVVIHRITQRAQEYSVTQRLPEPVAFLFGVSTFEGEHSTIESMLEEAREQITQSHPGV
ncbi:MAG: diguanylate cyclase [Myxococcales bacterium]|nr:diguanylate cyclase [Myxococcales bacterium]